MGQATGKPGSAKAKPGSAQGGKSQARVNQGQARVKRGSGQGQARVRPRSLLLDRFGQENDRKRSFAIIVRYVPKSFPKLLLDRFGQGHVRKVYARKKRCVVTKRMFRFEKTHKNRGSHRFDREKRCFTHFYILKPKKRRQIRRVNFSARF